MTVSSEKYYEEFLHFAKRIAQEAGSLIMVYHERRREPIWTSPTHFKTAADDASDALMRKAIVEAYPDHNILSEEGLSRERQSRYTWVLDGIDGTIGFRTGITDHFSVCVAFCEEWTPVVGVVYAPKRGECYVAAKGNGAFLNDQAIRVSDLVNINQVLMGIDSGKHNRAANIPYLKKSMQPGGITCYLCTGCASVPLCLVGSGVYHAYLATSLEPEDMAAAVCIIREAGGKVTNLALEDWKLGGQDASILAANPVLHENLVDFFGLKKGGER